MPKSTQNIKSSPYVARRLANRILAILGELVHGLAKDQGFLVSVASVDLDRARKHATVWLSILQGEDKAVLYFFNSPKVKHELESDLFFALKLPVKAALEFRIDMGARHAEEIAELLSRAA